MENAKVYKLTNDVNDKIYIGSCKQPYLAGRFSGHKKSCQDITGRRNSKLYSHMREIGIDHFKIELIENVNCETISQLREREQYWITQLKPELNMFNAIAMDKEYYKERVDKENQKVHLKKYYETHKEEILIKQKEYADANKEHIKEQKKAYRERTIEHIKEKKSIKYTCDCGATLCLDKKARHETSKKHQSFISA
jgi:group I intron endonuclease